MISYEETIVVPSAVLVGSDVGDAAAKAADSLDLVVPQVLSGAPGSWVQARQAVLVAIDADDANRSALLLRAEEEATDQRIAENRDEIDDVAVYDGFFRVTRVASCGWLDIASSAAPALAALLGDVPTAPITLDDKAVLVHFGASLLGGPRNKALAPAAEVGGSAGAPHADDLALDPLSRWILGHHLFAFASRLAAGALKRAEAAFSQQDWPEAAGEVDAAREYVPAITCSMVYAAALSAPLYAADVRPMMREPHLDRELSGSMNLDYRDYKFGLASLVAALEGHTFGSLFDLGPGLARGVDELLSLDLLDFERHIALTHRLVGSGAALHERDTESAVQSLRRLYLSRLPRYLPLFEHGATLRKAIEGQL